MVSKIFHISDVHIRVYQRHAEYEFVFEELFDYIEQNKDDDSIILITGDIVHSKLNTSAEMFSLLYNFLYKLSKIAPTYVILGNHDLNLKNKSRLDPISPVIDAVNNKNLILLQGTKVHTLVEGLNISLLDVVEGQDNFQTIDKVPVNGYPSIAVYHGIVEGAMASTGFILDGEVPLELFAGFDAVLLGDIHLHQELANNVLYPGSLIQQNFGEDPIEHGLVVWEWYEETASFSYEFVALPNKHCFLVLDMSLSPKEILDYVDKNTGSWTKEVSLSLRNIDQANPSVVNDILFDLSQRFEIIKTERKASKQKAVEIDINKIENYSFKDQSNSEASIKKFMQDRFDIPDSLKATVDEYVNTIVEDYKGWALSNTSNVEVTFFAFENMFSYGKECRIDFTDFKGLTGIFAENASGKSTFFDSLAYAIFGKCSRTSKGSEVMNSSKDTFSSSVILKKGDNHYLIEKSASRSKSGRVSVNVFFRQISPKGELIEELNGQDRRETEASIKRMFGTYEDFSHTSFYTQTNNLNFIEVGQADRKNLLSYFLNLDLFNKWHDELKEKSKKIKAVLEYADINIKINDVEELKTFKIDYEDAKIKSEEELVPLVEKLDVLDKAISEKLASIKKIDFDTTQTEVSNWINRVEMKTQVVENLKEKIPVLQEDIEKLNKRYIELDNKEFEISESPAAQFYRIESKIKDLDRDIGNAEGNIERLKIEYNNFFDFEYDPDCEYCVKNLNIGRKDEIQLEIKEYQSQIKLYTKEKDALKPILKALEEDIKTYNEYFLNEKEKTSIIQSRDFKVRGLADLNSDIETQEEEIEEYQEKIKKYKENQEAIEHNKRVNAEQHSLVLERNKVKDLVEEYKTRITKYTVQMESCDKKISDLEKEIKDLEDYEQKQQAIGFLIKTTHRDGLPLEIMSNALPFLQSIVNELLSEYADFKVTIQNEGKDIDVKIRYEDGTTWDVGLTSGMERFLLSVSFKVALAQLTTLNKFNLLIIDEGFGALDFEKRSAIDQYLNNLKNYYNHIFCISHIDSMKDVVDNLLNVVKDKGFSSIYVN